MTAINFLPPVLGRIPVIAEKLGILWTWGVPDLLALICLGWMKWKHRKVNKVFAAAVLLLLVSQLLRVFLADTSIWLDFAGLARAAPVSF